MRYFSNSFLGIYIYRLRLGLLDCRKCFDLSVIEVGGSAVRFKADIFRLDSVELSKSPDCIMIPIILLESLNHQSEEAY
jgi:hypothetical protein